LVKEMKVGQEVETGLEELVRLVKKRKGLLKLVKNTGDMMRYRIAQQ
jgi:hypothetical protein